LEKEARRDKRDKGEEKGIYGERRGKLEN